MIKKLIYSFHRITGVVLSLVFLIWFLSAFVMMYHSFPKLTFKEKIEKKEPLNASMPAIGTILEQMPQNEKIKSISLAKELDRAVFTVHTKNKSFRIPADSSLKQDFTASEKRNLLILQWCKAPILKIDTLSSLDQWIPFEELKTKLPIYKVYFDDKEKHQLYIASKENEILQFTTSSDRMWAWLGAIPHWAYFSWLRQNSNLWSNTIIWLSGLGCIMVITGIYVGIDIWHKSRKRNGSISPYKKKWYHWHYITGLIFGFFTFTFCFSGMISVTDIPHWISHPEENINLKKIYKKSPRIDAYKLDYRLILNRIPAVRQLEWSSFGKVPYYIVSTGKKELFIDASKDSIESLNLSKGVIESAILGLYTKPQIHSTNLITSFETYYRDMSKMHKGADQLPVWKISVQDKDNSCYYINPLTAKIQYVNNTSRWKYWMYTALHRLRIPGLNSNTTLRKTCIWILLLGGTVVSLTGVILSIKYINRKYSKRNNKL